ncbi:unnamed protein product [Closterium sp. NIES-54]
MPRSWMVAAHFSSQLHLHSLDSFPLLPNTALVQETLRSLELLELEALALVVLELEELELEPLAWEALELIELELLTLETLCGRDRTSFPYFSRFLVSRPLPALLLPSCVHCLTSRSSRYSRPPHFLLLLLTLSSSAAFESVSDGARTTSPTAVSDPSFESGAASALVVKRLEFVAACCLDYATALVAESKAACPPSVGGECALGTDILEDMQEDFECLAVAVPRFASMLLAPEGGPDAPDIPTPHSYAEAITGPFSSQWQAPMDAEMTS